MFSTKSLPFLLLCAGLCACASRATPEDVQMSTALSAQGKTLLASNRNTEARDVYLSAVSRDDQNARAWNGLGVSYMLLGKRDDALRAYHKALDIVPNDMTASNNLAQLALEEGDPAAALRILGPFVKDKTAPLALRQNYARAEREAQVKTAQKQESPKEEVKEETKEAPAEGAYAEIGSYPTEGIARGYANRAKKILDDEDVSFAVATEVKVFGGTPVFVVKATGKNPDNICATLTSQAFPCIPRK